MLTLFDRVVPRLSAEEELSFVHRNLLPRFQMIIPRQIINSIAQLERTAKSIEKSHLLSKTYRPPPTPEKSLLPDVAYKEPMRSRNQNKEFVHSINENKFDIDSLLETLLVIKESKNPPKINPNSVNKTSLDPPSIVPEKLKNSFVNTKKLTCYNCGQEGHKFPDCKEEKKIFCYKCGHKDVTKINCPKCSVN